MKKILLLIIIVFLMSGIRSFAQFQKPTGLTGIQTYSIYKNRSDSTITIGMGSVDLYNTLLSIFDSVKVRGYATNYKLQQYKQIRDSVLKSGYATNYKLIHKIDSVLTYANSHYVTKNDSSKLYKLKTDSILNSGYASVYKLGLKQNQLSGTGYLKFTGTTPSYVNETYKLRNDSIANSGYYTNYKAAQSSYLANNTWTKVYDYAGNLSNLFKLSPDNIIEPGFKLGIDQLYSVADAGKVTIANMPNYRSANGDTLQYGVRIGKIDMLKMRVIANGSGGSADTSLVLGGKLIWPGNPMAGYYLKVMPNGVIKPQPNTSTYQGTWNATTNTPTLANGTGTAGFWYRCVVGGTINFGAGNITFSVGDDVIYSGTIWQRVPAAGYTLQYMTKTVQGGAKMDSVTIKYNASSQLRVDTTVIASAKALSTHAGLTTTAHGLGASAFHTDSYFKLFSDSALNNGYFTNYKALQYRKLNNHDSLSVLDEKNYSSLTGKPDLSVYKLKTDSTSNAGYATIFKLLSYKQKSDSVVNSGYFTNYKGSFKQDILGNDQWQTAKDYAGNVFNLIKVSKDNVVTIPNLNIKSFYFVKNAGINKLGWIPLDASANGIEQGYELLAGNTILMKLYGLGSNGDIDSARAVFDNVYIRNGAALNKIAMSEDSKGKVKWSDTKYLFSLVANRILYASNTNEMGQLPLGTLNNVLLSGGTGVPTWSNYTLPTTATNGKVMIGNGTNFVLSTPTFPNASAVFGKIIKSDGTNWVASTETYDVPGTSGNVMVSDGTNWTASNKNLSWDKWAQWDGGLTGLTASTGRTSLGGTTIGQSMFTLTNPSSVSFPKFNADNTVSALSASDFRTAIGAQVAGSYEVPLTFSTGLLRTGNTITNTITNNNQLINGANYITTESDPNIYTWARQSVKPSYTYSEVGAAPSSTISFPGFGTSHSTAAYGDHGHSGVYQPLATVLTNTTASYTTAEQSKLSGIAAGATNVTNTNQLTNGAGYITSSSVGNGTLTLSTSGSGISGSQTFTANQGTNATFTITSNATTSNSASTIVLRDGSGNVDLSGSFAGSICTSSDSTLKKNIRPFTLNDYKRASKVDLLKFNYKTDYFNANDKFGGIAQYIQKYVPEVVSLNRESGKLQVDYIQLLIILSAQHKYEIEQQKNKMEQQDEIIKGLIKRIENIEEKCNNATVKFESIK